MSSIETDAHAQDPRLRGRTYAIPFDTVWSGALALVGTTRAWRLVSSDDRTGRIHVEAKSLVLRHVDDLFVVVSLDEHAQTRVDVQGTTRNGKADLGRKARTIHHFLGRLDRSLDVKPGQLLDPTLPSAWSS